jgi:hypothetical protein
MGKPKEWSPTDPKHYEGKPIAELKKNLIAAQEFARKNPQFEYGWHNEYIQELKRRIAESIGRK